MTAAVGAGPDGPAHRVRERRPGRRWRRARAVATLVPTLPTLMSPTRVRRCAELRVEDLVDLPADAACLIVDAVAGVEPGHVVRMPSTAG